MRVLQHKRYLDFMSTRDVNEQRKESVGGVTRNLKTASKPGLFPSCRIEQSYLLAIECFHNSILGGKSVE